MARSSIRIKDNKKGMEALKKMVKKTRNRNVYAGITHAAGGDVLRYATINELGAYVEPGTITVTHYKRVTAAVEKAGGASMYKGGKTFTKKGRFVKKEKANYSESFTTGRKGYDIPSRPFMRRYFDNNIDEITRFSSRAFRKMLLNPESITLDMTLSAIGVYVQNGIKNSIRTAYQWAEPNAPSTIKKKGSSKPLIDHAIMINSVTFDLRRR